MFFRQLSSGMTTNSHTVMERRLYRSYFMSHHDHSNLCHVGERCMCCFALVRCATCSCRVRGECGGGAYKLSRTLTNVRFDVSSSHAAIPQGDGDGVDDSTSALECRRCMCQTRPRCFHAASGPRDLARNPSSDSAHRIASRNAWMPSMSGMTCTVKRGVLAGAGRRFAVEDARVHYGERL